MKKRHQAEEIIRILCDIEHGDSVEAGARRHNISEQTYYYEASGDAVQEQLIKELHSLSKQHPQHGYEKMTQHLNRSHWHVNEKRIQRLWRLEGLKVPVKQVKRRRTDPSTAVRQRALYPNRVWSWDFIMDRTEDSRNLKILNIVDEYSRMIVSLEIGRYFRAVDVILALTLCVMNA